MHDVVSNPAAAAAASYADWNKKSRGLGRRRDRERGGERRCFNIATWRTYSVTRRCTDGEWQCVFVHHWTRCTTTLQTARAPVSLGRRSVDVRGSATMLNCDITSSRLCFRCLTSSQQLEMCECGREQNGRERKMSRHKNSFQFSFSLLNSHHCHRRRQGDNIPLSAPFHGFPEMKCDFFPQHYVLFHRISSKLL